MMLPTVSDHSFRHASWWSTVRSLFAEWQQRVQSLFGLSVIAASSSERQFSPPIMLAQANHAQASGYLLPSPNATGRLCGIARFYKPRIL
jgi:hypothetical protein